MYVYVRENNKLMYTLKIGSQRASQLASQASQRLSSNQPFNTTSSITYSVLRTRKICIASHPAHFFFLSFLFFQPQNQAKREASFFQKKIKNKNKNKNQHQQIKKIKIKSLKLVWFIYYLSGGTGERNLFITVLVLVGT